MTEEEQNRSHGRSLSRKKRMRDGHRASAQCTVHESAREMHFKYKQMIGMVFGDDECTHLVSSGEAPSNNCSPLPLQVGEEEQHPLY